MVALIPPLGFVLIALGILAVWLLVKALNQKNK